MEGNREGGARGEGMCAVHTSLQYVYSFSHLASALRSTSLLVMQRKDDAEEEGKEEEDEEEEEEGGDEDEDEE